jgi:hypothetical protein
VDQGFRNTPQMDLQNEDSGRASTLLTARRKAPQASYKPVSGPQRWALGSKAMTHLPHAG